MSVTDANLNKETTDRYLTYALSVVSGRALPDVRDGLKPVQRRILFAMLANLNLRPNSGYRKSALVVGEVIGRFHPHGDTACYDAMVRMAQDFSLRYPLVDGQGNFGSMDGDSAAAYRYTEAKLREIALDVMGEIDEETVNFRDNFDATTFEPSVLPSRIPNLLINGATGIAVGMATSIPPHNLRDTISALIKLSEDSEMTNANLAQVIKGPDFPTGCMILNTTKEISEMYKTGRGSIRMRGDWEVEEQARGKRFIVVTSIPYAVNKSQLVERIASLIVEKKVPQLTDVRDESTDDVRIVIELASGADPEVAMAYVYKNTPLESNFPVNFTALVPTPSGSCRPELLSLKDCLQHFLDFREEVVQKRLLYEKKKLEERIHILEGLVIIYDALDVALKIVRQSEGRSDAADKLMKRFDLTEIQSFAVVDMRIYQLSRTNIEEIRKELKEKLARIREIDAILKSRSKIAEIVRKDLEAIAEKYGDKRRCKLVKDSEAIEIEFNAEDYVVHEDVYAIVTADGWIKRVRQSNELSTTRIREGDSILRAHALSTLDSVAFFTNLGSLYALKVTEFPASSGYGSPIQKILKFKDEEKIMCSFGIKASQPAAQMELVGSSDLLKDGETMNLISQQGVGFGLTIEGLASLKRNGKRVMKLRDGDKLAVVCRPGKELAIFSKQGYGLRIKQSEVPVRNDAAVGVALMGVRKDDAVIAAHGFSGKGKMALLLESGNKKEITAADVVSGHRGLKGQRVIARGEIVSVTASEG